MGPASQDRIKRSKHITQRKTCRQIQVLQNHYQTYKNQSSSLRNCFNSPIKSKIWMTKIAQQLQISRFKVYKWFWNRKKKDQLKKQDTKSDETPIQKIQINNNCKKEESYYIQNVEQDQEKWMQYEIDGVNFFAPEAIYVPQKVLIDYLSKISKQGIQILRQKLWQFNPIGRGFQADKPGSDNVKQQEINSQLIEKRIGDSDQ